MEVTTTAPRSLSNISYSPASEVLSKIPSTGRVLILADKDGTLDAKISNAEKAFVLPETVAALIRLTSDLDIKIVINSGRELEWLEKLTGPLAETQGVTLWGGHGHQRKVPGQPELTRSIGDKWTAALNSTAATLVSDLQDAGYRVKNDPSEDAGFSVEVKPAVGGLVIHFRSEPTLVDVAEKAFLKVVTPFLAEGSHKLEAGDMIFELKLKGRDKGAVAADEMDIHKPEFVLVLGDDTTDLDMSREVMKSGVRSLTVFVGDRPVSEDIASSPSFMRVSDPSVIREILDGLCERRGVANSIDMTSLQMSTYYREEFIRNR